MKYLARSLLVTVLALVFVLISTGIKPAQAQAPADRILINGKVLTVDENFSIAQAIAIRGERIAAVGTNEAIRRLSGPNTKVTDLGGKTVIPGLIDNHVHYLRSSPYWPYEPLFDAVPTRAKALKLIEAKVAATPDGGWILAMGGWTTRQFSDDRTEFRKEELNSLAPKNPMFFQSGFNGGYGNTLAVEAVVAANKARSEKDPYEGIDVKTGHIGPWAAQGRFPGMPESVRLALPAYTSESWKKNYLRRMNTDYNRAGITTVWNAGAIHFENDFSKWSEEYVAENGGWSNVRIFHHIISDVFFQKDVQARIDKMAVENYDQTNDYFRYFAFGEIPYIRVYDVRTYNPKEEDWPYYIKMLEAAAKKGWPVWEHMMQTKKIDDVLAIREANAEAWNIKKMRWAAHHLDRATPEHFERLKALNMFAAMHIGHSTKGGRRRVSMRFRDAQESGVKWGLGTDAKIVSPYPAFFILYVAVTGKNIPGNVIIPPDQTVTREQALIAYTRSNAWALFMEDDLGSIEPGKYADVVVLDRDYMTCPEEEIREIESVLTLVGGRVGYKANQ